MSIMSDYLFMLYLIISYHYLIYAKKIKYMCTTVFIHASWVTFISSRNRVGLAQSVACPPLAR